MFIDVAMVEAEQASIAGVRAGQKSRCKKGGFGHSEGITHSFYTSCTPQLYGDDLTLGRANNTVLPPSNRIIENEAGWYQMSNVSILARVGQGSRDGWQVHDAEQDHRAGRYCADHDTLRPAVRGDAPAIWLRLHARRRRW